MMYQLPKGALYVILMKTRLLFDKCWCYMAYLAGLRGIALLARYYIFYTPLFYGPYLLSAFYEHLAFKAPFMLILARKALLSIFHATSDNKSFHRKSSH